MLKKRRSCLTRFKTHFQNTWTCIHLCCCTTMFASLHDCSNAPKMYAFFMWTPYTFISFNNTTRRRLCAIYFFRQHCACSALCRVSTASQRLTQTYSNINRIRWDAKWLSTDYIIDILASLVKLEFNLDRTKNNYEQCKVIYCFDFGCLSQKEYMLENVNAASTSKEYSCFIYRLFENSTYICLNLLFGDWLPATVAFIRLKLTHV